PCWTLVSTTAILPTRQGTCWYFTDIPSPLPADPGQNGYGAMLPPPVSHCVSVNASRLASGPPNREPVPDAPTPPNGTFASSATVCSLMCTIPDGTASATCIANPTSPRIPNDNPYSLSDASRTASSTVSNATTGATGPKTSW